MNERYDLADKSGAPLFPRPCKFKDLAAAMIVGLLALLIIPWAAWTNDHFEGFFEAQSLHGFFASATQWGTVASLILVVAAVWFLDPRRRATLAVLLIAITFTSAANSIVKEVVGRARPEYGVEMTEKEQHSLYKYMRKNPEYNIPTTPGDHWLFNRMHREFADPRYTSFPSGHTSMAFGIASYLSVMYPPARVLWIAMAVSCGSSRVGKDQHYVEDVLFGGSLAWIIAHIVFSWSWPIRLGQKLFERRKKAVSADPPRETAITEGIGEIS